MNTHSPQPPAGTPPGQPGHAAPAGGPPGKPAGGPPPGPPVLNARIVAALAGVLLSAMMSGLNSRGGSLALSDIEGHLGLGLDGGSWVSACYSAGELMVMPCATWFAITFTVRRFYIFMVSCTALIGLVVPFVVNLKILLVLRLLQGISAGALIPLLMMMALRFLPPAIRLHGLALYAMTATFTPNVALWVIGQWTDTVADLRWVSWQFIPAAALCIGLVGWGLPKEPVVWPRFKSINWAGLFTGAPGLCLLGLGLAEANRCDWFHSPLISFCLTGGVACFATFVATEWNHPGPFIRFQLLERRNLHVGFSMFVLLLIVLISGAELPADFLASTQNYRTLQAAPLGLIIGLPQVALGSVVALLLYRKWVDARVIFALGLALIGIACLSAAHLDSSWTWRQFLPAQILQMLGQPMAVVSMLFLATSVVAPMEGPYVSGFVNTLRAMGTLIGIAALGRLELVREHFHSDVLVGHAASVAGHLPGGFDADTVADTIDTQVTVLTTADCYLVLGWLALILVPFAALFKYIPAPMIPPAPPRAPKAAPASPPVSQT